jgi:hypothetical protein
MCQNRPQQSHMAVTVKVSRAHRLRPHGALKVATVAQCHWPCHWQPFPEATNHDSGQDRHLGQEGKPRRATNFGINCLSATRPALASSSPGSSAVVGATVVSFLCAPPPISFPPANLRIVGHNSVAQQGSGEMESALCFPPRRDLATGLPRDSARMRYSSTEAFC